MRPDEVMGWAGAIFWLVLIAAMTLVLIGSLIYGGIMAVRSLRGAK